MYLKYTYIYIYVYIYIYPPFCIYTCIVAMFCMFFYIYFCVLQPEESPSPGLHEALLYICPGHLEAMCHSSLQVRGVGQAWKFRS